MLCGVCCGSVDLIPVGGGEQGRKMTNADVRAAVVARILEVGEWRRDRVRHDPGLRTDSRQRRSAAGLDELADYVARLPVDDARLQTLHRLAFSGGAFDPGASLLMELGRFRFFDAAETCDVFLDRMVELAAFDRREQGEFGGPQVPGDEPWRRG
jgi:hypothetical protein